MGIWIIVIIVAVVVAIAVGVVLMRRRGASDTAPAPEPPTTPRTPRPEPPPMTGLEEALNKATDRTGHTMADRLDAETDHVAELRETDDTGPLLRRALDSVDRGQDGPTDDTEGAPDTDEPDPQQP